MLSDRADSNARMASSLCRGSAEDWDSSLSLKALARAAIIVSSVPTVANPCAAEDSKFLSALSDTGRVDLNDLSEMPSFSFSSSEGQRHLHRGRKEGKFQLIPLKGLTPGGGARCPIGWVRVTRPDSASAPDTEHSAMDGEKNRSRALNSEFWMSGDS